MRSIRFDRGEQRTLRWAVGVDCPKTDNKSSHSNRKTTEISEGLSQAKVFKPDEREVWISEFERVVQETAHRQTTLWRAKVICMLFATVFDESVAAARAQVQRDRSEGFLNVDDDVD